MYVMAYEADSKADAIAQRVASHWSAELPPGRLRLHQHLQLQLHLQLHGILPLCNHYGHASAVHASCLTFTVPAL